MAARGPSERPRRRAARRGPRRPARRRVAARPGRRGRGQAEAPSPPRRPRPWRCCGRRVRRRARRRQRVAAGGSSRRVVLAWRRLNTPSRRRVAVPVCRYSIERPRRRAYGTAVDAHLWSRGAYRGAYDITDGARLRPSCAYIITLDAGVSSRIERDCLRNPSWHVVEGCFLLGSRICHAEETTFAAIP